MHNSLKHFFSFTALVAALMLSSCNQSQPSAAEAGSVNYNLDAVAFAEKINELPAAPVLDVRTPEEFANGHLQNAQNIDWNGSNFDAAIQPLAKDQPVFVYCLSGGRSSAAAAQMRQQGFTQVYELDGGILKWRAANLPEENPNSNSGMTAADFDQLLTTDKKVLIDFYADWCAPCKKMAPYLEQLKTEQADSVVIVRINADTNQALAKQLQVDALPALFLYKNKTAVWQHTGFLEKEELLKIIATN